MLSIFELIPVSLCGNTSFKYQARSWSWRSCVFFSGEKPARSKADVLRSGSELWLTLAPWALINSQSHFWLFSQTHNLALKTVTGDYISGGTRCFMFRMHGHAQLGAKRFKWSSTSFSLLFRHILPIWHVVPGNTFSPLISCWEAMPSMIGRQRYDKAIQECFSLTISWFEYVKNNNSNYGDIRVKIQLFHCQKRTSWLGTKKLNPQ